MEAYTIGNKDGSVCRSRMLQTEALEDYNYIQPHFLVYLAVPPTDHLRLSTYVEKPSAWF